MFEAYACGEQDCIDVRHYDNGLFISLLYYGSLRAFISFDGDGGAEHALELTSLLRAAKVSFPKNRLCVYFNYENRTLIAEIMNHVDFEPPYPNGFYYMSREFVMDREHFAAKPSNVRLDVRPYEFMRTADYAALVDASFTFASPPPNFSANITGMAETLSKKVFNAFYDGNGLIGVYWLDNDNSTIEFIAVAPDRQRRGYGHIILSHAIETVFSDPGKCAAKLYCVDWNEKGLAFYRKFGMLEKGHMQMMVVEDKING